MIENKESDHHHSEHHEPVDNKNVTADIFFPGENANPPPEGKKQDGLKCLRQALQSIGFQIFITLLAIFSLFSDDVRIAAFDSTADLTFDIIHIILICIFTIQMILSWVVFEDYRFSFFFFLDMISTFSILLDVSMITSLIYSNDSDSSYSISQIATQSRASRVATRAVRIVKLIRIIRIVKLYKSAVKAAQIKEELKKKKIQENKKKQKALKSLEREHATELPLDINNQTGDSKIKNQKKQAKKIYREEPMKIEEREKQEEQEEEKQKNQQNNNIAGDSIFDSDLIEQMSEKESKISKVLSDLTIKKIIIVVLLIMFLVPLFDSENYISSPESWDFTVKNVHKLLKQNTTISTTVLSALIEDTIQSHSIEENQNYIVYFSTPFNQLPYYSHESYGNLRLQEIQSAVETIEISEILNFRSDLTIRSNLNDQEDNEIYAVMNYRSYTIKQSLFSMGKTLFVCIVLIGMLNFFTDDINQLIVAPIENMMQEVMQMAKNPESVATALLDNTQYETALVHNAIIKIGALLSLVFGSAGAEIIGSNIMKEGDMNALIDGKKKCAIFGFCDIRNFTEVTELLQEDIMLFVNKIGELVHSSVFRYGGSANKNIGEAFLLVWPLPSNTYELNHKTNEITWKNQKHVSVMGDFSVYSFVKMIVKVHKDPAILDYKKDPRLIKGLGADYQVSMGFGLHIGWAIEGAIGSEYKIDASYLSPNVNMASRLEAATRQYGVHLLISEDLFKMLTPGLQNFCRNIDRVTVKGSAKPIRLYTIDLNISKITPPSNKEEKYKNPDDKIDVEVKRDLNMEYLEDDKIDQYDAEAFVRGKKELREVMIDSTSKEFQNQFEQGLTFYLKGLWSDANLHFKEALKYNGNDGPTHNLKNYIGKYNCTAPKDWDNYRPLTSK